MGDDVTDDEDGGPVDLSDQRGQLVERADRGFGIAARDAGKHTGPQ